MRFSIEILCQGGMAWRVAGDVAVEEEWAAGCSSQFNRHFGVVRHDCRSGMMLSFMSRRKHHAWGSSYQ